MASSRPLHRFQPVRERGEDGRSHSVFRVQCKCGAVETFNGTIRISSDVDTFLSRKLRERGWYVGPTTERCPACAGRTARLIQQPEPPPEESPMAKQPPQTIKSFADLAPAIPQETAAGVTPVAGPRVIPTPDEKRRIFREIDAAWDEGQRRYSEGFSDRKVAQALGLARVLVSAVRESDFGGPDSDERIPALISAANRKIEEGQRLYEVFMKQSQQAMDAAEAVQRYMKDVEGIRDQLRGLA